MTNPMTAAAIARAFDAGKAPTNGFYITWNGQKPGDYMHVTGAQFRRTATGRRTQVVDLTYFTNGRRQEVGGFDAAALLEIV